MWCVVSVSVFQGEKGDTEMDIREWDQGLVIFSPLTLYQLNLTSFLLSV